MNRYAITLGAATVMVGALVASAATAATIAREGFTQASGACQGALPNYEGSFRKRPLGMANEGIAAAYATCSPHGVNPGVTDAVELVVTNRGGADVDVGCTLVDGLVDPVLFFADYYPQTVTAPSALDSTFVWDEAANFFLTSISCNVPAGVELNNIYVGFFDEIGV